MCVCAPLSPTVLARERGERGGCVCRAKVTPLPFPPPLPPLFPPPPLSPGFCLTIGVGRSRFSRLCER